MVARRTRSTSTALRLLGVLVAGLALVACGSGSGQTTSESSDSGAPGSDGRPWTSRTWFDVEATDDPKVVDLLFWGPDAEQDPRCTEDRETAATDVEGDLDVTVVVHFDEGAKPADECPWAVQRIALRLEEPLGDRRMTVSTGDVAFVESGDGYGYEVVPETTPCGRTDCSTPSPTPAPCDGDAVRAAFSAEIDGGILPEGEARCDGSFLITDMDVGSSGCAPADGDSPCKNVKRAYFVANGGEWRVITYGTGETCESVLHVSGIVFPEELCA